MTAAPVSDDETVPKKPDIEEFIGRLLKSNKFEQLADKIAEKAADKIITLQRLPRYADRARDDVTTKPTSTTILKTVDKNKNKDKEDDSDKETEETKSNEKDKKNSTEAKTDTDDQEDIKEKPKIDTVSAMQKISKIPVADLSLNYKHFTTREKPISKSSKVTATDKKDKSKEDKNNKSQRKKIHSVHVGQYEVFQRAQPIPESDSQAEPKDKIESESSDESTDDEKERDLTETKPLGRKETVKKDKKKEKEHKKKVESGSTSSENDKSNSASNESVFKKMVLASQHIKTENSAIKKADNDVDKNQSEKNDVAASLNKHLKSTIAFGFAENSQEDSDDNIVSNIARSDKFDEKLLNAIKTEIGDDNKEKKGEEKDASDDKDNDDDKKNDSDEDTKNDDEDNKKKDDIGDKDDKKIDTKHKIRENKGKKYAFAESPDYEEYHEQVSNLLKSVKNDPTKRNTVNEDLLDLMDPIHT